MKRTSLMTVAASVATWAAPAFAADPAAAPLAFDWSGGYVGVNVGYGWGRSPLDFDVIDYIVPYDPHGLSGGVHAGYSHQFSNEIVAGVEGDVQFSGMGSSDVRGVFNGSVIDVNHDYYSDQKWNAALRARLGYAVDRFLPYVAGGLAVARYEHGETAIKPFSTGATYTGWTVGAGVDYAVTDNILLRAEYRHSDFGRERFDVPGWFDHVIDLKTDDVRFGVSYKF